MWGFIPVLSVSNSGAARGFQNCYIFLSENTKSWQGTFSVSLEPPMAKPIKKSHRRKAPAPRKSARRVAQRRATAGRRLRILERLPGLALEPIARGGAHGATQTTKHCADAGEPRCRSARRLRPTANRPAERTDDLRAHDDKEGDVCAMGRLLELDCYDGFAKRLFRVPGKPRRHGAQSGRDANCRRRIRRPLKPGRNFSWLQSLEIARNGIGIDGRDEGGGSAVVCAGRRPGSQSRISRGS